MAKDKYHYIVEQGLIDDGWTITDNPLYLDMLTTTLEVDLGAEKVIAATKGIQKIAVEIKSFIGLSVIGDFYKALGQFNFYHAILQEEEPQRVLYLAMPESAYHHLLREPIAIKVMKQYDLKFILYQIEEQKINKWIK